MIHFIGKTFIFLLVTMLLIFAIFIGTIKIFAVKGDFSFDANKEYLFVGHSHSECAFNDSIVEKSINLSLSGETYFYIYPKIKQVLIQNPNIKNVFIEYSNNQINKSMNNWIWDNTHISYRLPIYYPFMELKDIKLLLKKNRSGVIKASSKTYRRNLINILRFDYNYTKKIGSYRWLERNKTDSLIEIILNEKHLTNKKTHNELSITNIEYLEKIIDFCKKQDVDIYLIRSPQHKFYNRENEKIFVNLRKEKFRNIDFLDFNDFPLHNAEFGDFGHLNHKGAKIFSSWFNELLKKGLLSMENKSEFIISEMEQVRTHNNVYKKLPR